MSPRISICIPAYKRVSYLKRLLDSIAIQTFKDFEVIITDDSDDDSVQVLLENYSSFFSIIYSKNIKPLGTPANWNDAINKASGEWIKLMHDDDWFSHKDSLSIFVEHTQPDASIIFSAYTNIPDSDAESKSTIVASERWLKRMLANEQILFVRNIIGPPSVTLIHRRFHVIYDEQLKWRVDIDFYVRVLQKNKNIVFIKKPLINIGLSAIQVTQSSINNPNIELREAFIWLRKYGIGGLKDIFIYDSWWRLMRNMNISSKERLLEYVNDDWPEVILNIVDDVGKIGVKYLKNGLLSKTCMLFSYMKNRRLIK